MPALKKVVDRPESCSFCNSTHIELHGYVIKVSGKVRRFKCVNCGRTFY